MTTLIATHFNMMAQLASTVVTYHLYIMSVQQMMSWFIIIHKKVTFFVKLCVHFVSVCLKIKNGLRLTLKVTLQPPGNFFLSICHSDLSLSCLSVWFLPLLSVLSLSLFCLCLICLLFVCLSDLSILSVCLSVFCIKMKRCSFKNKSNSCSLGKKW